MGIQVDGQTLETTSEGFLVNQALWTPAVAEALAAAHSIELNEGHWEILKILRAYCESGHEPPSMRELSAEVRRQLAHQPDHARKASSLYLMTLFGPSPAKMSARLAGLPRPRNCL